jgi:hypothetical protein
MSSIAVSKPNENQAGVTKWCLFLLAHIPLALFLAVSPWIATAHVAIVSVVGVGLILKSDRIRVQQNAVMVAAYIVGAEVMWRMTEAKVFWEVGKYMVILCLAIAIVRRTSQKRPLLPAMFFLLLLPSLAYTIFEGRWGLNEIRQQISFNLSGPFTLLICTWFFAGYALRWSEFRDLLFSLLAPVIGIATVALGSLIAVGTRIQFTAESNFVASGGFGPNQVSAVLGLGVVVTFLLLVMGSLPARARLLLQVIMIWLSVQSLLTFSRTGIILAIIAIMGIGIVLLAEPRTRMKVIAGFLFISFLMTYLVFPQLETYTQGAFSDRYSDTTLGGREQIALLDYQIWQDHLVTGVGVGRALLFRQEMGYAAGAHTEFTRMLAEHGLLGLLAVLIFCVMAMQQIVRANGRMNRAVVIGLILWSGGFMVASAFRLAAPAFALGITFATLQLDLDSELSGDP